MQFLGRDSINPTVVSIFWCSFGPLFDMMRSRNNTCSSVTGFANPNVSIEVQDKVPKRKKCLSIRNHAQEYSEKTSLHGLQYIGERRRPLLERIGWSVVFATSLLVCFYNISNVWERWINKPVIVSLGDRPTAIWEIPFPALTICPEVKARQQLFSYSYQLENLNRTEEEEETLKAVSMLCINRKYQNGENITSTRTIDIFEKVAPPVEEIFVSCKWLDLEQDCSEMFKKILTSEGICYTHNMLNSQNLFGTDVRSDYGYFRGPSIQNWDFDTGYVPLVNSTEYPYRGYGIGNLGGIEVTLNAFDHDFDSVCRHATQGFKFWLHNSYELPKMDDTYLFLPTDEKVTVAIKPQMTVTSRKVKVYDISKRKCYLQGERPLRFYNIYSPDNCQMECIANFTFERCGCVGFYMPHFNTTPVCGSGLAECMKNTKKFWRNCQVIVEVVPEELVELYNLPDNCNCLPSCTSIDYDLEIGQAKYHWQDEQPLPYINSSNNNTGMQLSRLRIAYKNFYFIPSHRSELYGPTDFIANCGGLLGLFMGFSFLSLVEVIYFCTFRIWGTFYLRRKSLLPLHKQKQ